MSHDYLIGFDRVDTGQAQFLAVELRESILEAAPDADVTRERDAPDASDLGAVLGVVLGSASLVAVAGGIQRFLDHRGSLCDLVVRRGEDSVEVTRLRREDAARLASEALAALLSGQDASAGEP